jgi:hypothetical protein
MSKVFQSRSVESGLTYLGNILHLYMIYLRPIYKNFDRMLQMQEEPSIGQSLEGKINIIE